MACSNDVVDRAGETHTKTASGESKERLTEVEYYARMFKKLDGKPHELYSVSRIFHRLDDPTIELRTQQPVRIDQRIRLLDVYFPQFGIGVEIDEPHHANQKEADTLREQEIIGAANIAPLERVVFDELKSRKTVDARLDEIVDLLRARKADAISNGTFAPFSYGERSDAKIWLKKGTLTTSDDAQFVLIEDVCTLFEGAQHRIRKGFLPMKDGRALWFPQLAQKGVTAPPNWKNSIAEDGRITEERLASGAKVETEEYSGTERLVFARFRDPVLGVGQYYRFYGRYVLESQDATRAVFERIGESVELTGKGAAAL